MEQSGERYLLRLPASGGTERIAVPQSGVSGGLLAALLHTDVTERMRLPVMPEAFAGRFVLCYFIDARGGERTAGQFCGNLFLSQRLPDSRRSAAGGLRRGQRKYGGFRLYGSGLRGSDRVAFR